MNARILVVDDTADMRELIREMVEDAGYEVIVALDGREALRHIEQTQAMIDLVITDVCMPGNKGNDLLAAMRKYRAEAPVIVITAFGSVEQAVEIVKAGAFQYLTKPFEAESLLRVIEQALEQSAPQREQARLRRQMSEIPAKIIGASCPMRELFNSIAVAAHSASNVLITGESGTGKELVARAVHELSQCKGEFVPVNCAAVPAELIEAELFGHTGGAFTGAKTPRTGLFEAAHQGTLFLDEIGEMPLAMQPKLLRALQEGAVRRIGDNRERQVNVRVVAATNRNLEKDVSKGRFREDLFWRLNVIQLRVPPLRERLFDIPLLVQHFLTKIAQAAGKPPLDVSHEALDVLTAYTWPGNVRELENALESAVAFATGAVLTPDVLPKRVCSRSDASELIKRSSAENLTLRELEREYILGTLRRTKGNKKRAAELLGLDRKTLYRKLIEYRAEGSQRN